jgi:hypothetical protein
MGAMRDRPARPMRVDHPEPFLADSGGLHDARIECFLFDVVRSTLILDVADLDANFARMPGYAGPRPARLLFAGVGNFQTDVRDFTRNLWILELSSAIAGDRHRATMVLVCGDRMAWDFTGFEIHDVPPVAAANP